MISEQTIQSVKQTAPVVAEHAESIAYAGTDVLGRMGTGNDLAIIVSMAPEARAWLLLGAVGVGAGGARLVRRTQQRRAAS